MTNEYDPGYRNLCPLYPMDTKQLNSTSNLYFSIFNQAGINAIESFYIPGYFKEYDYFCFLYNIVIAHAEKNNRSKNKFA